LLDARSTNKRKRVRPDEIIGKALALASAQA
jgi:hypothetical protein